MSQQTAHFCCVYGVNYTLSLRSSPLMRFLFTNVAFSSHRPTGVESLSLTPAPFQVLSRVECLSLPRLPPATLSPACCLLPGACQFLQLPQQTGFFDSLHFYLRTQLPYHPNSFGFFLPRRRRLRSPASTPLYPLSDFMTDVNWFYCDFAFH